MRFYALGVLISLVFAGWTFDYQGTSSSIDEERLLNIAPIGYRILNPVDATAPDTVFIDDDEEEPTP